ncbi:MAG: tyrosine-type recombinase/integrase, partial [Acidobacteriota bacterium]
LHGQALDLLRERHAVRCASPLVLPSATGTPSFPRKRWQQALREAEIEDFRFHDLRHTAASYLAMNGATLAELADVLGHKSLQMVKRYAHLAEAHTHDVVRRMNERMLSGEVTR